MLLANCLFAQEDYTTKLPVQVAIPPIAKLNVSGTTLEFSIIGDDNQQIKSPSTIGEIWLNYSSVVEPNTSNTIYASLTSKELPPEIIIRLSIGPNAGAGLGQTGTPTDPIVLTTFPQPIICNIGSCFTGQGTKKGHLLTYSWDLLPNADLEAMSKDELSNLKVGIMYTIVTNE